MNLPNFEPMSYAQCGHFKFEEMTDEDMKSQCRAFEGNTEEHGKVTILMCDGCAEKLMKNITNRTLGISVEGE